MDNNLTKEQFIEECQFAKIVDTASGNALLIAGIVFEIQGSPTARWYAQYLAAALRRGTTRESSSSSAEAA